MCPISGGYVFINPGRYIFIYINNNRREKLEELLKNIVVSFKFFKVQQEDGPAQTKWKRLDGNTLKEELCRDLRDW